MDKRKLVKSGNTSFTVALPINWIRKNSLDQGDEVDILENTEGDLVISGIRKRIGCFVPFSEISFIIASNSVKVIKSLTLSSLIHFPEKI